MNVDIFVVIFFALIGSVFSMIGGIAILFSKKSAKTIATYATPFAAGALLAAAFTDLLPDALDRGDIRIGLYSTLGGILLFFILERSFRWFHHHHEHEDDAADPTAHLVVIGDTVHNLIDGIALAAAFLVNMETGIVVTLAIAAHEIPKEIGDFGLMLHKGMSRRRVLIMNFVSAMAALVSAVVVYAFGGAVALPLNAMLGMVAGFFIYIAVSDVIPEIHETKENNIAWKQAVILVFGALLIGATTTFLHGFIG